MTVVDELRWKRHKDRRGVVVIAHGGSELEWFESFLHPRKTCTAND